jgi:hypothetical protein
MTPSAYNQEELLFLQAGITTSKKYIVIADEFSLKYRRPMSKGSIAGLVARGQLKPPANRAVQTHTRLSAERTVERYNEIKRLCVEGLTSRQIGHQVGMQRNHVAVILHKLGMRAKANLSSNTFAARQSNRAAKQRQQRSKVRREPPLKFEDPIANIGVSLMDLRANGCHWPVALDPEDKRQRFCGEHRRMNGHYFASSYCCEHDAVAHYPRFQAMEAAE